MNLRAYSSEPLTPLDANILMASERLLIVDLRDPVDFRCGHLPQAINPGKHGRYTLLSNRSKDLPLLFYGDGGDSVKVVAELFADLGFSQCFYLESGYEEWQQLQQSSSNLTTGLCQWLLDSGYQTCDINQRGFNGETPLMTAAKRGLPGHMIELIDHGADINAVNADSNSVVWLACYSNNVYALMVLVQEGALLDGQNVNGATPLIYAASAGRLEMVRLLLMAGADIRPVTLDGFSALDVAASWDIVKLLRYVERGSALAANPLGILKQTS